MLETYAKAWPNHPFVFHVPYNSNYPEAIVRDFGDRVRVIRTPKSINETVLGLLKACDCRNQTIYFAIDDYYPVEVPDSRKLDTALAFVRRQAAEPRFAGMALAFTDFERGGKEHRSGLIGLSNFPNGGGPGLRIGLMKGMPASNAYIWCHGFWREWVVRGIYSTGKQVPAAKGYEPIVNGFMLRIFKSDQWDIFRSGERAVTFQETTHRGKVDRVTAERFKRFGVKVPAEFLPASRSRSGRY